MRSKTFAIVLRHLITVAVVVLTVTHGTAPVLAEWNTFQSNAAHTGYVPVTIDTASIQERWSTQFSTTSFQPLVASSQAVFLVSAVSPLAYGLDAQTGNLLWDKQFLSARASAPAYQDGRVYLPTNKALHAVDALTGAVLFDAPITAQSQKYGNPVPYEGSVYAGGGQFSGVYSFDGADGAQNWFGYAPPEPGWSPAVDEKYVYIYSGFFRTPNPGALIILDRTSGGIEGGQFDPLFETANHSTSVVLGNHDNAFTISGGNIISWDTRLLNGTAIDQHWSKSGDFLGQPTLAGGKLFVSANGNLNVLDELTGALLWDWAPPIPGTITGPMLATDNLLFVTAGLGSVHTLAIDLDTHQVVWSRPFGGPMAISDSTLYIAAVGGEVHAFTIPEPSSRLLAATGFGICFAICALTTHRRRCRSTA